MTAAAVEGARGTPRVLKCGHTFCEDCVVGRLSVVCDNKPLCVVCPHCNRALGGTVGKEFPVNFQIAEVFRLAARRRRVGQMLYSIQRQVLTLVMLKSPSGSAVARQEPSLVAFIDELIHSAMALLGKLVDDEFGSAIDGEDDRILEDIRIKTETLETRERQRMESQHQSMAETAPQFNITVQVLSTAEAENIVRRRGHRHRFSRGPRSQRR